MRVLFVIIIYGLAKQITFQRVGCNHFSSARFYGGLWSKDYRIKGFVVPLLMEGLGVARFNMLKC